MAPTEAGIADCTVVIPTYNERENIADIISAILAYPRFKVLVVDDNSPDGTGTIVAGLAQKDERIELIARPGKLGLGTAYIAGFKRALEQGAQYIFEMDADFSHNPIYLPSLLEYAEQNVDLAIGSRYIEGGATTDWGLIRQLISRGGNLYTRLLLGLKVADATSGFRCYRRRVLESIDLDSIRSNGYSFQVEMAYRTIRAGFRVGERPIVFPDRRVGKSKMSSHIVVEAFITVLKLRFAPHLMRVSTSQMVDTSADSSALI
ncbi:MAG: polyprenol monophosphomannose synthase [Chloroflexaceae bacterium]|nr:polyprenol monophosphomannose synthase [Chloroflexaceae bacterium]